MWGLVISVFIFKLCFVHVRVDDCNTLMSTSMERLVTQLILLAASLLIPNGRVLAGKGETWENIKLSVCRPVLLHVNPRVRSGHDDVIKWKHFPRYWPFVWGIHRSPVNSPHKGQWRGALMFTLICAQINGWVNNHEAGDLRRYRAHYDVMVMVTTVFKGFCLELAQ